MNEYLEQLDQLDPSDTDLIPDGTGPQPAGWSAIDRLALVVARSKQDCGE